MYTGLPSHQNTHHNNKRLLELTKVNHQSAIALPHVVGEGQNAGQVVVLGGVLLLRGGSDRGVARGVARGVTRGVAR